MRKPNLTVMAIASSLVLAGCGSGGDAAQDVPAQSADASALDEPTSGAASDPGQPKPKGDGGDTSGDSAAAQSGRFSSAYTPFSIETCTLTSSSPEASGGEYRCPGRGGIPLFVQDGDARMDIDAGVRNDRFETTGPFNSIGDTIEWRMKDGKPFAIIFRYSVHNEIGPQPTELAIETIGSAGAPGCRIGQLAGKTPNANRRAREIADASASGFRCGVQKPTTIGGTLTPLGG